MVNMNRVFVGGNLTRNPDLRQTPGGMSVCDLAIAVNRFYNAQNGEKKQEVCYLDVVVWGKMAENCNRYLTKGSPVLVEGRLQMDSWQTKEGEKRSKIKINATSVQFLSKGSSDSSFSDDSRSGGGMPASNQAPDAALDKIDWDDDSDDDIPF